MDDRLSSNQVLDAALRSVAQDDEQWSTSAAVESRLLAAARARARVRHRRLAAAALLSAAVLFLTLVMPIGRHMNEHAGSGNAPPGAAVDTGRSGELATEFFPLAYSLVPAQEGHIVRMQVPRTALQQFGISSFDAQGASPTVLADVFVGDDGLARAVRFVRLEAQDIQEQQP